MDVSTTLLDGASRKHSLEDLSKDDLVKKYRNLLIVAQKAKSAKDVLQEEIDTLKSNKNSAAEEVIESLTQQKLKYVSTIDVLNNEKSRLLSDVNDLRAELKQQSDLDVENQSLKRQISRLLDENEQLLTHLDGLEKQIEDLNKIGLEQQQQLLLLEQANINQAALTEVESNKEELQKMLSISLDEVKKLQTDNNSLNDHIDQLKTLLSNEQEAKSRIDQQVQNKNNMLIDLQDELPSTDLTLEGNNELVKDQDTNSKVVQLEIILAQNKREIDAKTKELESVANVADDLKTELHRNKALVEVLRSEIKSTSSKLSNNQIVSSGITSDLENDNEKLRNKVKLYHGKIVKFATEVRKLRESKEEILETFKVYNCHVKCWKQKLEQFSKYLSTESCKYETLSTEFNALKVEYNNQNSNLKSINSVLLNTNEELDNLRKLTENQSINNEEYSKIVQEFKDKTDLCNNLQETISELRPQILKATLENTENLNDIAKLKSENDKLHTQLEKCNKTEAELAEKSSEEITSLVKENDHLKATIATLQVDVLNLSNNIKLAKESVNNMTNFSEEAISTLKRENSELLTEMNQMNQALKERGESISHHQTEYEELLKRFQQIDVELKRCLGIISEKEAIISGLQEKDDGDCDSASFNVELIKEKDAEIASLKQELAGARERLNADVSKDYAESDMMSTSTISRAEELGRFKDLDGSWEERYTKLRNLALKLKAKIREQTAELAESQSDHAALNLKLTNCTRLAHTLQGQLDTALDELERARADSAQYLRKLDSIAQDISRDKDKLARNDEVIGRLRSKVEAVAVEKGKTEAWKKQVSLKVQSLKKELEANSVLKRDFESKILDLNSKLEQKDRQLREEISRHTETKNNLLESNSECKKQSVLNLEMQDYERSGKELNQRLEKKTEQCKQLREQLEQLNRTSESQLDQVRVLEARAVTLDRELEAGRRDVADAQKKCSDLATSLSDKEVGAVDLIGALEEARRDNEDLNTQLSKIMAGQQKTIEANKNDRDSLQMLVLGLEQRLAELSETLRLRDLELSNVKTDYEGYKVRAQSVLRQNQSRDIGTEEKLSEEADSLRIRMNIVQNECDELKNSVKELKLASEELSAQKLALDNKLIEFEHIMELQKSNYDTLSDKYEAAVNDHAENVKILKTQSDTLSHCYRTKLSDQESRHNQEVLQLQGRLDQSALHSALGGELPSLGGGGATPAAAAPPPMAREAAEGSESVDSANGGGYPGTGAGVHPLEHILGGGGGDSDVEVTGLRRQVLDHESKANHLTELLADTEQDLAKHIQMNLMLKEEIRRQQRSVEREQHAENLEYMKNVVVKFITLNNGDERQRLVPVLNTILKLSPDETQRINAIARGDSRGWSNYLPTWSKPQ